MVIQFGIKTARGGSFRWDILQNDDRPLSNNFHGKYFYWESKLHALWRHRYRQHHKIFVFGIISYVDLDTAPNFKLFLQPSNIAATRGLRRSSKLYLKANLGCNSNIATVISDISVFVSSWYSTLTELQPFRCQSHMVALWFWPLTYDLEKSNFLKGLT